MSKRHYLKILPEYFWAVIQGSKPFEVRKNDRDYQVGDLLELQEWTPETQYTGNRTSVGVTYILSDPEYVKPGYVIMGLDLAP